MLLVKTSQQILKTGCGCFKTPAMVKAERLHAARKWSEQMRAEYLAREDDRIDAQAQAQDQLDILQLST